jgi:hypothetical protein
MRLIYSTFANALEVFIFALGAATSPDAQIKTSGPHLGACAGGRHGLKNSRYSCSRLRRETLAIKTPTLKTLYRPREV